MTHEITKSFTVQWSNMEGMPKQPQKPERRLGTTRRGFLATALNGAVAAGVGYSVLRHTSETSTDTVPDTAINSSTPESFELTSPHERFAAVNAGYRALFAMKNEVLFITADGRPVATVAIKPIDGILPGASYQEVYGAEGGIVTEGFGGDWLAKAEANVLAAYPELSAEDVSVVTNWNALDKAMSDPDELMTREHTRSIMDVVHHFGDKPVRGAEHLSRIEYVRDTVTFTGNLAKASSVVAELRRLLPGLCAVESTFNDGVTSSVGARGIFQFKPDTWHKELGRDKFEDGISVSLTEQTAAAGELFSKMYDRLFYWCYEEENYGGRNYLEDIKQLFASQEDFERYFFVPCLLNAYNTGEKGIGEVVVAYAQSTAFYDRLKLGTSKGGLDIFQEMTTFGRDSGLAHLQDYGDEASRYVQKIYAFATLLDGTTDEDQRIASLG